MEKKNHGKTSDILDILIVLVKDIKFISIFTILVSIFAVIYSLLTPEYWISTATILPAEEKENSLPLSSSLLNVGASFISGNLNLNSMDFITILKSRTFSEDIIKKFDLVEYFEIKGEDEYEIRDKAVLRFSENMRDIDMNHNTGLIFISIESKDKYMSAEIANYFCEKLEEYNLNQKMSKGKQKRIFIEKRINEVKSIIDTLSNKLNKFKKSHNIIELPSQTKSMIDMYATLISQRLETDIELEYQENVYKNDTPLYEHLQVKRDIIDKKIKAFEESQQDLNIQYGMNLNELSDISLQYGNLLLDLEIQNTIYEFLYPQYENAKIEEIKDLPTLDIIDIAVPAGIRSKPHRAKFCITMFLIAIFISVSWVLLKNVLNQSFGNEKNKYKIKRLRNILFHRNDKI